MATQIAGPIEDWEIQEKIKRHPEGIGLSAFLRQFGNRVGEGPGQMPRKDWIKKVKLFASFGKEDKLLRPMQES
jgi:transcription initiation factor TFIIF subunit alpha